MTGKYHPFCFIGHILHTGAQRVSASKKRHAHFFFYLAILFYFSLGWIRGRAVIPLPAVKYQVQAVAAWEGVTSHTHARTVGGGLKTAQHTRADLPVAQICLSALMYSGPAGFLGVQKTPHKTDTQHSHTIVYLRLVGFPLRRL